MNDSPRVGGIKGIGDLDRYTQHNFHLGRLSCNAMLQRHAIEKLHGDKGCAMLVVNFVDGTDVRMIQCRGSLGFPLETVESLRVFGYLIRQELESYKAAEFEILGLVNHTHAATTELFDNSVVRDGLADHWRESYVCEKGKSMKAAALANSQNGSW